MGQTEPLLKPFREYMFAAPFDSDQLPAAKASIACKIRRWMTSNGAGRRRGRCIGLHQEPDREHTNIASVSRLQIFTDPARVRPSLICRRCQPGARMHRLGERLEDAARYRVGLPVVFRVPL